MPSSVAAPAFKGFSAFVCASLNSRPVFCFFTAGTKGQLVLPEHPRRGTYAHTVPVQARTLSFSARARKRMESLFASCIYNGLCQQREKVLWLEDGPDNNTDLLPPKARSPGSAWFGRLCHPASHLR